jgi:hypothetical protein
MKEYRANISALLTFSAIIGLVIGSFYLLLTQQLDKTGFLELIWNYSMVTIPIAGVWLFFEHFGWRLSFFRRLLKSYLKFPPDLRGRWEGEVDRNHENNPHKFVFEIYQTFTKITVRAFSENSESQSIAADLTTAPNTEDYFKLCFLWQGETGNTLNGGAIPSGQFFGYSICRFVQRKEGKELIGEYFTDRKPTQTRGKLTLKWVNLETIGNFN